MQNVTQSNRTVDTFLPSYIYFKGTPRSASESRKANEDLKVAKNDVEYTLSTCIVKSVDTQLHVQIFRAISFKVSEGFFSHKVIMGGWY